MDRYHCSSKYFLDERRSLGISRWKVYNEYNLSCSQRLWYLVWLMNKQDWRITHVQGGRQLRSFNIQIYKDLVFFLLLVGFLLRRGLISSLNSVAWFVPVKETSYISHFCTRKKHNLFHYLARSRQTEPDVWKTGTKIHNYKPDTRRTRLQLRWL